MLHSVVGSTIGRGKYVPFSMVERSDLWPAARNDSAGAGAAPHDLAGVAQGLIAGTLVATELGWQPVEDLQTGDRVITFDNGMRPLKSVKIATLYTAAEAAPRSVWPLAIPEGVLGNRTAMQIMPGQSLLIESDAAEALFGDAFLMVQAGVLDGFRGIGRAAPAPEVTVVTLEFEGDEVVYANGTVLVQCPAAGAKTAGIGTIAMARALPYQRLTDQQGRRLIAAMHLHG